MFYEFNHFERIVRYGRELLHQDFASEFTERKTVCQA